MKQGLLVRGQACRAGRWSAAIAAGTALASLWTSCAHAAPPPIMTTVNEDADGKHDSDPLAFVHNWRREQGALGDMWGLREALAQHGVTFAVQETSEALGNLTGGTHKSLDYDGLTQAIVQVNSQRAFGYYGGTFNVSALQLHGLNLSARNLGTLQTASGIESDRATRLWELWYDQKLLPEDRLDIRVGQQSLDQEWMVSTNALMFVNTMFGWPMLPSANMPGGGPAYPLSAPGIRVRYRPVNALAIQLGAFSSSPFNMSNAQAQALGADAQQLNPSGTSFPFFKHGTLLMGELQYTTPALGGMVSPDAKPKLSATYRLGVWYDSEQFADVRYGGDGLLLADPNSDGSQRLHRGNLGIYGVMDRMIWRSSRDPNRTLSVFGRAMGTPFADRNTISYSANLGFVLKDPLPYRTDDSIGIGMGFARVSPSLSQFDSDTAFFTASYNPRRTSETYIEATYQRQITPWLQLQPDIQYVFNPGGGVANDAGTARIGNEVVVGIRTNILL
ncbi:carbohydrate porin [Novosphingobium terrae]|uniref:carbohydrate porin n=1 Tax=Novosphingobium terrae TaxID=2726189 RepID=UPI001F1371B1|nr:carbohydrate porin [Novosphingobium terrae]